LIGFIKISILLFKYYKKYKKATKTITKREKCRFLLCSSMKKHYLCTIKKQKERCER